MVMAFQACPSLIDCTTLLALVLKKMKWSTLTGQVQDQAALLGMLNRLVDMGLPLLLVQYIPNHISENLEA